LPRAESASNSGTLYAYSIVHRSFPGIEVPYVSAIVDLDGGGTVEGARLGMTHVIGLGSACAIHILGKVD
jgi:uncharacterized OB-fold protein